MSKRVIIAVVGVLFAIYIAAAPYITVYQMKSAAERYDGEAFSEFIDFPSVRQSLKDQMNAMIISEMAKDEMKDNPFSVLGAAFGGIMVDKMVEAYVTPAGITQLMSGEKPKPLEGAGAGSSSGRNFLSDATMSYESLDKFVLKVKGGTNEEGKFILRRHGIGWKLTEIIIPRLNTDRIKDESSMFSSQEKTIVERVNDEANVLSLQEKEHISKLIENYELETSHQLCVITVKNLVGESIEAYSLRMSTNSGLGLKGIDNRILIVVAPNDRKARIELGRGFDKYISNVRAQEIMNTQMLPAFRQKRYAVGIERGLMLLMSDGRSFVVHRKG